MSTFVPVRPPLLLLIFPIDILIYIHLIHFVINFTECLKFYIHLYFTFRFFMFERRVLIWYSLYYYIVLFLSLVAMYPTFICCLFLVVSTLNQESFLFILILGRYLLLTSSLSFFCVHCYSSYFFSYNVTYSFSMTSISFRVFVL